MDNLTHTLVGTALARAGLDRTTPLATATLVLAANAPDIDVFAYVRGPYFALAFRRGITHGIPAMVVLPFAVTGAVLAWDRWVRRRRRPDAEPARAGPLLLLSFLGLLSHPALDWMNTYGMRWWLPLDGGWVYGDSLFIIDPWLWLMLGAATLVGKAHDRTGAIGWAALGLVATALLLTGPVAAAAKVVWLVATLALVARVAAGRPRPERRVPAARALGAAALIYTLLMVAANALARRDVLRAAERAGVESPLAVMVGPRPADPLGGDVVVRTPDGYVRGTHRWRRAPRAQLFTGAVTPIRSGSPGVPPDEVDRAVAGALTEPDARHYLIWSRFPYYRVEPAEGGWRVTIADARYDARGSGSLGGVQLHVGEADGG